MDRTRHAPLPPSRRQFLAAAASATVVGAMAELVPASARRALAAAPAPTRLIVERRVLKVRGKAASVFGIRQRDGTHGLFLDPAQRFRVDVENRAGEDAVIHWHGQSPPYRQDGVADADADRRADMQEVTVLLHDFTFKDTAEILAGPTSGATGA